MSDATETTPHGWDEEHWSYQCSDGKHESFWQTVVTSPEWKEWEREIARRMRRINRIEENNRQQDKRRQALGLPELERRDPKLRVWDTDECKEAGWISPAHFLDFVKFLRTKAARRCRDKNTTIPLTASADPR